MKKLFGKNFPEMGPALSILPPSGTHLQFGTCSRWHHSYTNPLFLPSDLSSQESFSKCIRRCRESLEPQQHTSTRHDDMKRLTLPIVQFCFLHSAMPPASLPWICPRISCFTWIGMAFTSLQVRENSSTPCHSSPSKRKESVSLWMQSLWKTRLFG